MMQTGTAPFLGACPPCYASPCLVGGLDPSFTDFNDRGVLYLYPSAVNNFTLLWSDMLRNMCCAIFSLHMQFGNLTFVSVALAPF